MTMLRMLRGGTDVRVVAMNYRRVFAALAKNPFASSTRRMRAARRLLALGFTFVEIPDAGWVSLSHLQKAGWCP